MKRFLLVLVVAIVSMFTYNGCNGCNNTIKHLVSEVSGLNRTVVFYSANGDTIATWNTSSQVESEGGSCFFLTKEGKAVRLAGSYSIIEE